MTFHDLTHGRTGDSLLDRLMSHVQMDPNTGCWLCDLSHTGHGHTAIRAGSRMVLSHRLMWEAHNGPIPSGKIVLHKCDTPACVNPDHLRAGTHADNMRDMAERGRCNVKSAKLTPQHVRTIRREYGQKSSVELGRAFGVHGGTIMDVVRGNYWRHVQ